MPVSDTGSALAVAPGSSAPPGLAMTNAPSPKPVGASRRIFRILVLWVLVPVGLLFAAAASSLYLLCTYKPEIVASSVQYHLRAATGLPWRIGGAIKPALWPYPGINAADVRIAAATTGQESAADPAPPLVHARNVLVYFDPASLFQWRPIFQRIELVNPVINLAYGARQQPLWLPPEPQSADAEPPGGRATAGPERIKAGQTRAERTDQEPPHPAQADPPQPSAQNTIPAQAPPLPDSGHSGLGTGPDSKPVTGSDTATTEPTAPGAPLERPDAERTSAEKLERAATVICSLPPSMLQPMTINSGSLISWKRDGGMFMSFTDVQARFLPDEEENFTLSAAFDLPGANLTVRFTVAARVGCEGIPAMGRISGDIAMTPPGSRTLTARFTSSALWSDTGRDVLLPDFRIDAEGDTLTADLTVNLVRLECTGKATINRLSLTRWFKFGRVLPPGLREALHTLTGSFDLVLDATKAEAHNLNGIAGSLAVKGYVGTPDFGAPVVVVDVDLDRAELDPVFPFLAAVGQYVPEPQPPVFDHPPLAPYPEDPSAPPTTEDEEGVHVGYDITIRVARPRVHDMDGGPLTVTVLPVTVAGVDKTRVGIEAGGLLTGSVKGRLDIDEKSIVMRYDVKGMELALLPENRDNTVRLAGKVTGACDMELPFLPNGDIADDWSLGVNAAIAGCAVTGFYDNAPWQLYGTSVTVSGSGSIFAVLEKGVRIEGDWNLGAQGVNTSWHPSGNDKLAGVFKGGLFWPPIKGGSPPSGRGRRSMERKGVELIKGALQLDGSLVSPLGPLRVPVTGKLSTNIDWRRYDDSVKLQGIEFTGMGSHTGGNVSINFSSKEVVSTSDASFKINPRELLRHWKMLPPPSFLAPRVLIGRVDIESKGHSLAFTNLKVEADGAPITGTITWQDAAPGAEASDAGHWTFRLTADHLDLDTFMPPDKPGTVAVVPSRDPWKLGALTNLSLDAQITLKRAKRHKLSFSDTKATAALQRNRFSVHCESRSFYDGKAVLLFQGTMVPDRSQVTLRKGLIQMERVNFGKLLQDFSGESHYGGSADLVADYAGTMTCDADIPSKLSGVWSLNIKDGLYPAFLSNENSTLRNTFSVASASGPLDKGVLRAENFLLSGPMVDMAGTGWYDLNHKTYDIQLSATFAKVPTVPMRFYGNAIENRMNVRGADMVVETVQAAGSTVFELVKGVLSLPAYAVQGIGSLFDGKKEQKPVIRQPATTMPVVPHQTGGVPVRP